MTVYYVGKGGSDSNDGLSWDQRKLTLNGAEDIPVAPADTVYVGPGVYRETLTCDVNGTSGNQITYEADVLGHRTDGIGGEVRITGSNDDLTATRANCIFASNDDYRTWRGFKLDGYTNYGLYISDNSIVEDIITEGATNSSGGIILSVASGTHFEIRRCIDIGLYGQSIVISGGTGDVAATAIIENCIMYPKAGHGGTNYYGINSNYGNFTIRNCTLMAGSTALFSTGATTNITVRNCIFTHCDTAMVGDFTDDYNLCHPDVTRNIAKGANSVDWVPIYRSPVFIGGDLQAAGRGHSAPSAAWFFGELSQWSQIRRKAGATAPADDFFGIARPTTNSKCSWGAIQYARVIRETTTVRSGGVSMRLSDATRYQMIVPMKPSKAKVRVYVYREANYAGTNPQIIIKQPGKSDQVVTDSGSAEVWNLLSLSFTPENVPPYIILEFVSNNTATSGAYGIFFDDLTMGGSNPGKQGTFDFWINDYMPVNKIASPISGQNIGDMEEWMLEGDFFPGYGAIESGHTIESPFPSHLIP